MKAARAIIADPVGEIEALVGSGADPADAAEESASEHRRIPRGENRYR